jgi:hypothetical protein
MRPDAEAVYRLAVKPSPGAARAQSQQLTGTQTHDARQSPHSARCCTRTAPPNGRPLPLPKAHCPLPKQRCDHGARSWNWMTCNGNTKLIMESAWLTLVILNPCGNAKTRNDHAQLTEGIAMQTKGLRRPARRAMRTLRRARWCSKTRKKATLEAEQAFRNLICEDRDHAPGAPPAAV